LIHFYKRDSKILPRHQINDVLVQSYPATGHGDHPLSSWELLWGQVAGVGGVKGEDPGVDEARP